MHSPCPSDAPPAPVSSRLQESSSPCVQVLGLSLPGRLPLSCFLPPPLLPLDERGIVMPTSLLSVSVSPAVWHWPIRVDPGGRSVPEAPAPWGEPLSSPGESEGRRHGGWWRGTWGGGRMGCLLTDVERFLYVHLPYGHSGMRGPQCWPERTDVEIVHAGKVRRNDPQSQSPLTSKLYPCCGFKEIKHSHHSDEGLRGRGDV